MKTVKLTAKQIEIIQLMRKGIRLFNPISNEPYFLNYWYDKGINYGKDIEPLIEQGLIVQYSTSDFMYLTFDGLYLNLETQNN